MSVSVKKQIINIVKKKLTDDLETAKRGQVDAIEESKHHKGTMESRYDTFKEEAQYLTAGFTERINQLEMDLAELNKIETCVLTGNSTSNLGTLISAESVSETYYYFIASSAGGMTINVDGRKITVLTPLSPLGNIMSKVSEGETLQFRNTDITITNIE